MKKLLCLAILTFFSWSAFPNGDDWQLERPVEKQAQPKKKTPQKQRMEDTSSSAIGGSRSGELQIEKNQEEQLRREAEKQKFLYEYEDRYRRGL